MKSSYFRAGENLRFKMITLEEERDLFQQTRAGSQDAREFLVMNHRLFAMKHARRCARGCYGLEDDEVVSCGIEAIMGTIDSHDFTRGIRYTALLRPHIRGLVRRLLESKRAVTTSHPCVSVALGTTSTSEMCAVSHEFEEMDLSRYNSKVIARAIKRLNDNHREIIESIFFREEPMKDLSKRRKVSRQAVHLAYQGALRKLKELLLQEGLEKA